MKIIYEPGDPVRLKGKRGLYRFVRYQGFTTGHVLDDGTGFTTRPEAEVINPRRETAHVVEVDELEYPGPKATPRDVAPHPGVQDLSERAHRRSKL